MPKYKVPVIIDSKKRTILVDAADEWDAQSKASNIIWTRKVTKKQPYPLFVSIDQARLV